MRPLADTWAVQPADSMVTQYGEITDGNLIQAKGMTYNAVAPAELERMRKAVQPVVEKISAALKPETVKIFNDELDRIRKDAK